MKGFKSRPYKYITAVEILRANCPEANDLEFQSAIEDDQTDDRTSSRQCQRDQSCTKNLGKLTQAADRAPMLSRSMHSTKLRSL